MKIRVVKTASQASAVQVVRYRKGKRIIVQHIGSAHSDAELENLMVVAQEWINDYSKQLSVFPDKSHNKLLLLNHCTFIGVLRRYFYEQINLIQDRLGFDKLPPLLKEIK
ncbi:MAG TPA: hypothetical protein PK110_15740 [Niabella sp.]|jgi:hypothetical protein|nr:hypothetical protein [Chitinophagaceae bacterium]HRO86274.1 hypothetical protein [Niabella sp.]HUN04415.1 hypothetical protein [Niabella sp.]